jgi:conjugative relaxase-like TrwC/TraI family protein
LLGFAKIAGGMPSSTGSMTDHLMNQTLSPDQAKLALYYGRGMVHDDNMLAWAQAVADGIVPYSEAVDALLQKHVRDGGDLDLLDATEERIGKRLADLAFRVQEGLQDAPLAVVRPDIHPLALAGLGIEPDGLLSRDEINALLAGRRADGELIEGKHYVEERRLPVDPKTGEERFSTPIGSYDFCPTPDKSVSVAWAFAGPVEQAMIYNAHIEAAREAVGYIAAEVGRVRLGKAGQDGTEDGHVAWLEFTHHTSRRVQIKDGDITRDAGPGDPDLHTHFLMPNAVFSESGKVGSLDTAAIGGFIFEADAFYHARIGQKLRDAGFEVELDHKTGAARMPIVPDDVRTLFSKRTLAGEALARKMVADEGLDWDALAPEQRATRTKNATQSFEQKQKGGKDDVADVADWRQQAKVVAGWEPGSLQLYGPPPPPLTPEQRIRQAYEVALPHLSEKLEQNSVVKHWDLRVAALRGLVHTGIDGLADVSAITKIMAREGVQQSGEQTAIVWGQEAGKRYQSITTTLHQSDEQEFIQLMQTAAADKTGAIPTRLLQQKISQSGLEFSDAHGKAQRAAIERLGQGGRFGLVIGAAGMGKSASLSPLVSAWKEQGREVYGASLAWRQADDLANAGIDTRNIKAFSVLLAGIEAGGIKLTRNSVVAVDEWGMLGTRSGLALLRAQEKHGFSIVALGDDKQCASIEAGPIIDLSRRALGVENVPEILTTKRQKTEREREIVGLLREGRAAEALEMKREDGTAELAYGGRAGVITRVAKLYAERLAATGQAPGISAPTNQHAHDISAAVRIERRALGLVGADVWTVKATDGTRDYSLPLAPGDRVRLFQSAGATYADGRGGPIGRNGTVLEVMDANAAGLTLKNDKGRVGFVDWDKLAHGNRIRLAYGDAMTINTAQGSSRGEQISAFPEGTDRVLGQQAYSSLTRHIYASHLVTNEQAERVAVQKRRPINDGREITAADKWANVARSFAHQPEKDSALALFERVRALRQGGIKAFQATLLPAQPGHRVGNAPSQAQEVTQRQKMAIETKAVVQVLKQVWDLARNAKQRVVQHMPEHQHRPTQGPRLGI